MNVLDLSLRPKTASSVEYRTEIALGRSNAADTTGHNSSHVHLHSNPSAFGHLHFSYYRCSWACTFADRSSHCHHPPGNLTSKSEREKKTLHLSKVLCSTFVACPYPEGNFIQVAMPTDREQNSVKRENRFALTFR